MAGTSTKSAVKPDASVNLSWSGMFKFVWQLLGDLRPKFLFLFISLVVIQFYELLPPLIVGRIVDIFSSYQAGDSLEQVVGLLIFLGVSHLFVAMLRAPARLHLKSLFTELVYRVRVSGFKRLIDFSLGWHEQENSGNKVQRLQHGIQALESLGRSISSGGGLVVALLRVTMVIFIFIFLNPPFVIFGLLYFIIFFTIHSTFARKAKLLLVERNARLEKASGSFYEGLTNVLTIKSLGGKQAFTNRVDNAEAIARDYELKVLRVRNIRVRFFHLQIASGLVIFLGLTSWEFIEGNISLGDILIYYNYLNRLIENSWELVDLFDEFQTTKQGLARMVPIFQPIEFATQGKAKFPNNWQQLSIRNGEFNYRSGDQEFNLNKINLDIKRGEIIGVAGRSGSGKSTLVKLLLGLYELKSGTYKIDGHNFYDLSQDEVTKRIAIVLQESELFNMSLRDNISLLAEFDSARLEAALEIAQLKPLVAKLPQGLDSLIGEKGYKISGGERQRLGVARALYKDTDIIIFDEATSNLDTKTEAALQTALETKLPDKTMIIIAHRLSTLRNVDRIYLFDDGRIVETGKFQELIKDSSSKFAQLYQAQLRR